MDEQLAAIYGTAQPDFDETDLEKTAAAELLVKLAEEQGVDLNDFSDEEVTEMLNDLYKTGACKQGEGDAPPPNGAEKTDEEKKKEEEAAKEKVAEADYLGRIMAHSMVQELNNIEKEAGKASEMAGKAWGAVKGGASKAKEWVKGRPEAYASAGEGVKGAVTGKVFGRKLPVKERLKLLGQAAKQVAPEAGAAAGLGGAAYLATRGGKKKQGSADGSALEALAQQRAFEMAKQAGYIDEEGNFLVETQQVKEASALDLAIERRALEICESEGIPVEWNE